MLAPICRFVLILALLHWCVSAASAGDAPYSTSFETDAALSMPAGWTVESGASQFVTDGQANSGSQSFYHEAAAISTTESHYAWSPGGATPWTLSFALMISSNSNAEAGNRMGFGLHGIDTWGATVIFVAWEDTPGAWVLGGAGDTSPTLAADTWYQLSAEFDGGAGGTGTAKWYLDGVSLGPADLAEVRGSNAYLHYDTQAQVGSVYTFIDDINAVPEPASMAMLTVGAATLIRRRTRRRARS